MGKIFEETDKESMSLLLCASALKINERGRFDEVLVRLVRIWIPEEWDWVVQWKQFWRKRVH